MTNILRDLGPAVRIARREMRGGPRFFGVFLACLVLGVGAVTGVGILSSSLDQGIRTDAKRLLGGDLEIQRSHLPVDAEVLDFVRERLGAGGGLSASVGTRTMARVMPAQESAAVDSGPKALLAELRAVDAKYPLYGAVELQSGLSLARALEGKDGLPGAVAAPALFERLGLSPGDRIQIGDGEFVLTDVLEREPDRAARFYNLGPRLMIRLSDLERTGLVRPGAMLRYIYKIRLGSGEAEEFKTGLRARFPENTGWRIRDFSGASGGLKRFIDNLGRYLLLVGLATLLTGGIGVANGVKRFLDSRLSSIAVMKCVGADNGQVFLAYLVQILALALAGSLAGLALGWIGAEAAGRLVSASLGIPLHAAFPVAPLALGLACGLLTALAFSLPALSGAVRVSPVRLFSGYADPGPRRPGTVAAVASAACAALMLGLIPVFAGSPGTVAGFAAAMAVGAGLLALLARVVRFLALLARGRGGLRFRHAVANMRRPGASTTSVLFSLGLGLTVITAVVQLEHLFDDQIGSRIPETAPSYFFLDVPDTGIEEFRNTVLGVKGVTRMDASPSIRGRVVRVNGVPAEEVPIKPDSAWALRSDRSMSFAGPLPEGTRVVAGSWWPEDYHGPPLVSFDAKVAEDMGLKVGQNMTLNVLGREITATVASLREIDWTTGRLDHTIVFSPGVLEKAPHTWLGAAYADPEGERLLFRTISERWPSVPMIYLKDVLGDVREMAGTVASAVHAAAVLALVTGLLILAEAVRANLASRHRDAVIFKVCGATRGDVTWTLAMEFGMLGAAASAAGIVFGLAIAWGFATWAMHMEWAVFPVPLAVSALCGMLAVIALGLTGVRSAVNREAWTVLRNE